MLFFTQWPFFFTPNTYARAYTHIHAHTNKCIRKFRTNIEKIENAFFYFGILSTFFFFFDFTRIISSMIISLTYIVDLIRSFCLAAAANGYMPVAEERKKYKKTKTYYSSLNTLSVSCQQF